MLVWLEVLLNLSGYAGLVALARCGAPCAEEAARDKIYGSKR